MAVMAITLAIIIRVVKAQSINSLCIEKIKELFATSAPLYSVVSDGGLRFKGRLVVPDDEDRLRAVLSEAHKSQFTIHPGGDNMYQDVKRQYWWTSIKKDITVFVSKYDTCQLVKVNHQRSPETLQPLPILEYKWDSISMDFISGLSTS